MKIVERFKQYIAEPEDTLLGKVRNIMLGVVFYIGWIELMFWLYKNLIPEFSYLGNVGEASPESWIYTFLSACILAPLIEEALYRLPLSIANNMNIKGIVLYTAIISSVLFGRIHWGEDWTVPWQGVAGIFFCYVYIKNGYSYISTVTMHFIINLYYFFL